MKSVFRIICLLLATACFGQEKLPHPYVDAGVGLMPAGYASFAIRAGGGFMFDRPHIVFDSYAGYDNGHKVDDNTPNNYKGHDRFLRGFLGYKQGPWYAGVGARWSQLSTSNYSKGGSALASGSWHPEIGGGRDWDNPKSPLFMRTQVLWMFREQREVTDYPGKSPCVGCGSGSEGADITLWFPSPARKGHWFCKMNFVLFGYHDSITDPKNIQLTRTQVANKHFTDSTELTVGFRF